MHRLPTPTSTDSGDGRPARPAPHAGRNLRRIAATIVGTIAASVVAGLPLAVTTAPVATAEPASVISAAAAYNTTYVVTAEGNVYGAGANSSGQIPGVVGTPVTTLRRMQLPAGVSAVQVAAGRTHVVVRSSDGRVFASGVNSNGQLGLGDVQQRTQLTQMPLPAGVTATDIAAGINHTLVIGSNGVVYGAGTNVDGQLGLGKSNNAMTVATLTPMQLPAGVKPAQVAAGFSHSAVRSTDGKIYSCGNNTEKQQGDGTTTARLTPAAIALPNGVTAQTVVAGGGNTGFLGSNAKAYMIGWDGSDQTGLGLLANRATFTPIALPAGTVPVELRFGALSTVVRTADAKLVVVGFTSKGQLGTGMASGLIAPTVVSLAKPLGITRIVAGDEHTVAIATNGRIYATGANNSGSLGDASTTQRNTLTLASAVTPACAASEACATVFGTADDTPVPADEDGDGWASFRMFHNGTWQTDRNRDGSTEIVRSFGTTGDQPVTGDFDANGAADMAVFRNGTWYVDTNNDGIADQTRVFGSAGDVAFAGEFGGSAAIDIGVFRPGDGNWYVDTNGDGNADLVEHYASPGDVPAPADYDGNGSIDFAVFRPSNGCFFINDAHAHSGFTNGLPNGYASTVTGFASAGDRMASADYAHTGKLQLGVFRPSNGTWYLRNAAWNVPRGDEASTCS